MIVIACLLICFSFERKIAGALRARLCCLERCLEPRLHDGKLQEYREAHETGKCGDFYLGQRNAQIFVGQIG
jgi:hypothetical protein